MSSFDVAAALNLPELPTYLERMEARLRQAVATENPYFNESLVQLLETPGKRLRPSLLLAIVASQGKQIDDAVITSCAAVELLHQASLVHDDIIDNAASRHGAPTIHPHAGAGRAILIGDYLVARAFRQAASVSQEVSRSLATAFASLCDGQARELADIGNLKRTQTAYLQAIRGKSAALFAATCRIGGLHARLSGTQLDALSRYGENFGMAYQIIDDVLDFTANPKSFGKPVGTDLRAGNYTLPVILALAGTHSKELELLLQNSAAPDITNFLIESGTIESAILEVQKYNDLAASNLKNFSATNLLTGLASFPTIYQSWAMSMQR